MNAPAAYQVYAETAIISSDPVELTRMLYRAAIEAIRKAADALASGDIRERAHQIGRVQQILAELLATLDATKAPELSDRLTRLYEYVLYLLQAGNFEQKVEPLLAAKKVLETLLEGWNQCDPANLTLSGAA